MKTYTTKNEKPQFDPTSKESHITLAMLDGLYVDYSIQYGNSTLDPFILIEGAAPGADSIAWWWATQSPTHNYEEERFQHLHFPAEWYSADGVYQKWAGPARNKKMLNVGKPDLVLAFSHDIENSKGTKHMCTIAKEAGVSVYTTGGFNV